MICQDRLWTHISEILSEKTRFPQAADQFLRYTFHVGHLLRPTGNTLAATFGVAEAVHPGTSGGRFTFSTAIDWAPQMLTHDRQGRATFGFGLWKSVYLAALPHALAITHLVPLTYYAGRHPTSRLSDDDHDGFVVNVTVDIHSLTAVAAASVSAVGSWPDAQPISRVVALQPGCVHPGVRKNSPPLSFLCSNPFWTTIV